MRHNPLGIAHALAAGQVVDFRQPGERILVHRGAEEALRCIVETPEFRVTDIPALWVMTSRSPWSAGW